MKFAIQLTLFVAACAASPSVSAEQWLELFAQPGIVGKVTGMTQLGGKFYLAGNFVGVGTRPAKGLASYDVDTDQFRVVDADATAFGGLRDLQVFPEMDGHAIFALPVYTFQTSPIKVLRQGVLEDVAVPGEVSNLARLSAIFGEILVATGSFADPSGTYGLAYFDGDEWQFAAPLISETHSPIVHQTANGSTLVALGVPNSVVTWNGRQANYFELAVPATSLASANGVIYICSASVVRIWDNGQISNTPFPSRACDRLSSRPVGGQELLVIDHEADRTVTDGVVLPVAEAEYPVDCPDADLGVESEHLRLPEGAATIRGYFQSAWSFCLWVNNRWWVPEPIESPGKDLVAAYRQQIAGDNYIIGGSYVDAQTGEESTFARWTEVGFRPLVSQAEAKFAAVSQDLTTFAQAAGIGGAIRVISPTGVQDTAAPPGTSFGSIIAGGADDSDQFFFHDGWQQVYELNGGNVSPVGQPISRPPDRFGLHYVHGNGPASGLYVISQQFDTDGRSLGIWRLVDNRWTDVTPAEFTYMLDEFYPFSLHSFDQDGQRHLFVSLGDYAGRYSGTSWTFLPAFEGAEFSGPFAPYRRDGETCYYAAAIQRIARFCNSHWEWLPALTTDSPPLTTSPQITGLTPSRYLGQPVLLARGYFSIAGRTVQNGFAVLALETLFLDGME
ncbi:MAG: hypothetical protein AAGA23_02385 [Pseudomonadota bacterium]